MRPFRNKISTLVSFLQLYYCSSIIPDSCLFFHLFWKNVLFLVVSLLGSISLSFFSFFFKMAFTMYHGVDSFFENSFIDRYILIMRVCAYVVSFLWTTASAVGWNQGVQQKHLIDDRCPIISFNEFIHRWLVNSEHSHVKHYKRMGTRATRLLYFIST